MELTLYDNARELLAKCVKIDEVLEMQDWADMAQEYARRAKDRTMQAKAITIRLRAERRLGELIKAQGRSQGRPPADAERNLQIQTELAKGKPTEEVSREHGISQRQVQRIQNQAPAPVAVQSTLKELGINPNDSCKAKTIASMNETDFEQSLAELEARNIKGKTRPTKDILSAHRKPFSPINPEGGSPTVIFEDMCCDVPIEGDWNIFVWCNPSQLPQGIAFLKKLGASYRCLFTWSGEGENEYRFETVIYGFIGKPQIKDNKGFRTAFTAEDGKQRFLEIAIKAIGRIPFIYTRDLLGTGIIPHSHLSTFEASQA